MKDELKDRRFQLRLTRETYWRIDQLAKMKRISKASLIEKLVDDAWDDQMYFDDVIRRTTKQFV